MSASAWSRCRPRPEAGAQGVPDLVGTLGPDAGHGTFVAGLVRQACPEARILSVRLFRDNGVVDELDLLRALQLLCLRQLVALRPRSGVAPFDVVTMSLGYYHEQPDDPAFDPLLRGPLTAARPARGRGGRLGRQRRDQPALLPGRVRGPDG